MPSKTTSIAMDSATHLSKSERFNAEQISHKSDTYSATSANDAVVVKILSNSLNRSLGNAAANSSEVKHKNTVSEKFELNKPTADKQFDIKGVTANVVGFVESALANLAKKGFNTDQLSFFKNEAISGVKVGIDQAKLELVGLVNDDVYKMIDDTKDAIIGGIHLLPVEPKEYQSSIDAINKVQVGEQRSLNAIEINSINNKVTKIDFDSRAFNAARIENERSIFTSSSSNTSFSVQGDISEPEREGVANLVNKVDGLANSFYRGNIERAYRESIDLGYNDREILVLANQVNHMDSYHQIKAYGDIQHLVDGGKSDFSAPKAVAEYVNKYLEVLETSQSTLAGKRDFNQVINGLVNQMKDVQVPDLLQAINRFHTFNSKFN